jgi:hypothetical protein
MNTGVMIDWNVITLSTSMPDYQFVQHFLRAAQKKFRVASTKALKQVGINATVKLASYGRLLKKS